MVPKAIADLLKELGVAWSLFYILMSAIGGLIAYSIPKLIDYWINKKAKIREEVREIKKKTHEKIRKIKRKRHEEFDGHFDASNAQRIYVALRKDLLDETPLQDDDLKYWNAPK